MGRVEQVNNLALSQLALTCSLARRRCENGFVLEGNCPLLDDYYDSVARNNANVTKLCKSQPVYKNRPACEAAK